MRKLAAVSLALALLGCETGPPPATAAEKDAATTAYIVCLHKAARELDDHQSNAYSIAVAVAQQCAPEFNASVEVASRGMAPLTAVMFHDKVQPQAIGTATMVVLDERNGMSN